MPWDKSFDVDERLDLALRAFWSKGFEATSIEDLVASMGVNRGSLYATYGDKHSLFLSALRRYDDVRKAFLGGLERENSPRQAILAVFEAAVAASMAVDGRCGCFLVNTCVEMSAHDTEIAAVVAKGMTESEAFFARMIRNGQAAGEIPAHVDAIAAARGLLALLTGLRVLARSWPEKSLLRAIASQAEALLR